MERDQSKCDETPSFVTIVTSEKVVVGIRTLGTLTVLAAGVFRGNQVESVLNPNCGQSILNAISSAIESKMKFEQLREVVESILDSFHLETEEDCSPILSAYAQNIYNAFKNNQEVELDFNKTPEMDSALAEIFNSPHVTKDAKIWITLNAFIDRRPGPKGQ